MRQARFLVVLLTLAAIATFAAAIPDAAQGDVVWFRFKKSFINSRYPADVAFGSIQVADLWKVGPTHTISGPSCSGTDGEVQIGVYEEDLGWPGSSAEFSFPVGEERVAWGLVLEPPNVTAADRTALLAAQSKPMTFGGYLRVWNEDHWNDEDEENERDQATRIIFSSCTRPGA